MSKTKIFIFLFAVLIALMIISFWIPKKTNPSPDTRIILEHTHHTYIAPTCYQQSGATNYIEDSTLASAQELDYDPHDACTEDALKGEKESLIISLLKDIGIVSKKWDNW